MREIKFRAWNKKYKFMYDNIATYPGEDCNFYYYAEAHPENKHLPGGNNDLKDVIVMQYTGLRDKNSKDIFEDDILKSLFNYKSGKPLVVMFDHGCFFLRNEKIASATSFADLILQDFEIVGNIWENPKFLK